MATLWRIRRSAALPHFIDEATLTVLLGAEESLAEAAPSSTYNEFLDLREEAIIGEIRQVCGIAPVARPGEANGTSEDDEVAADLLAGPDSSDEELDEDFDDVA
jgi:hypothetical protein